MDTSENTATARLECRPVTSQEVADYRDQGWVKLPRLLPPATVAALHEMAVAAMGEDGQGNPVSPYQQPFFNPEVAGGPANPRLAPLLHGIRNRGQLPALGPDQLRCRRRYSAQRPDGSPGWSQPVRAPALGLYRRR